LPFYTQSLAAYLTASTIIIVTIPRAEGCYVLCACFLNDDQRFTHTTNTENEQPSSFHLPPLRQCHHILPEEKCKSWNTAKDTQKKGLPWLFLDCEKGGAKRPGSDRVLQEPWFLLNKSQVALLGWSTHLKLGFHLLGYACKNSGTWS